MPVAAIEKAIVASELKASDTGLVLEKVKNGTAGERYDIRNAEGQWLASASHGRNYKQEQTLDLAVQATNISPTQFEQIVEWLHALSQDAKQQ